jgi:hypothetical protein
MKELRFRQLTLRVIYPALNRRIPLTEYIKLLQEHASSIDGLNGEIEINADSALISYMSLETGKEYEDRKKIEAMREKRKKAVRIKKEAQETKAQLRAIALLKKKGYEISKKD